MVFWKIAATTCTISAGGSGGIFGPPVFIGARLGGAFGDLAEGASCLRVNVHQAADDGVPGNVAYRGDLFRIKSQTEGEELVIIENRYLVALFAELFIEGILNFFPMHQTGDTGDGDKIGLGLIEYGVELGFGKFESLLRSAFHEAAGSATAL
jgi:hypothetical protein